MLSPFPVPEIHEVTVGLPFATAASAGNHLVPLGGASTTDSNRGKRVGIYELVVLNSSAPCRTVEGASIKYVPGKICRQCHIAEAGSTQKVDLSDVEFGHPDEKLGHLYRAQVSGRERYAVELQLH